MPTNVYCQAGDKPKLTIISAEGTEVVEFENGPIDVIENPLQTPCIWVSGNYRANSSSPIIYWQKFVEIPWEDLDQGIYPELIQPANASNYGNLIHKGEIIATAPYPGSSIGFEFLGDWQFPDYQSNPDYENWGGSCSFEQIGVEIIAYDYNFNNFYLKRFIGNYQLSIDCGSQCPEDSFPVNDNSQKGYTCVPYEDIINWSKQQRQKLNQIERNLKNK